MERRVERRTRKASSDAHPLGHNFLQDSTFCRQTSTCSLKSDEDPYASAAGGPTLLSDEALFDDDGEGDARTCAPVAQARSNYHEADAEEQLL